MASFAGNMRRLVPFITNLVEVLPNIGGRLEVVTRVNIKQELVIFLQEISACVQGEGTPVRTKSLNTLTLSAVTEVGWRLTRCEFSMVKEVGVTSMTETISDMESSGRMDDWVLELIVGGEDDMRCGGARKREGEWDKRGII
jgi:hypothetical protein